MRQRWAIIITAISSLAIGCSTTPPVSGSPARESDPEPSTAAADTGPREPRATLPPPDEDWSMDPEAIAVRYGSLAAQEADVEQPECTAALGADCGPPLQPDPGIQIPVLSCKDRRQCNGEWRLRCKLFGVFCLTSQRNGGCGNHSPGDCQPKQLPFYQAVHTASGTINYRSLSLKLKGNQTLNLGTCGEPDASFTGDTFLRLFHGANEVASNDDACDGLGSHITYTAPVTGTYTIRMGCFSDTSCEATVAVNVAGEGTGGGELGRISTWSGKVNVHKAPGQAWTPDADCTSGADVDLLTYCRKFFPAATSVSEVPLTSKPSPVWNERGCAAVHGGDGLNEYTCDPGAELGRIGYWSGKVNIHLDASGIWRPDPDCTSGANLDPLTYCRKFWPSTASAAPVEPTTKLTPVWTDRGCVAVFGGNGVSEFSCMP